MAKTYQGPRGGDIVFRPKTNGMGLHWGRLAETTTVLHPRRIGIGISPEFVVAHTTPGKGKHLDTPAGFFGGLPGGWIPQALTEPQRYNVQLSSVANLGKPYTLADTCEDDVFGFSPSRDRILQGVGLGIGIFLAAIAVLDD